MTSAIIAHRMIADVTQKMAGPNILDNTSATGERTMVELTTATIRVSVVSTSTSWEVMIPNEAADEEKGPGNVWLRSDESQLIMSCTAEIEETANRLTAASRVNIGPYALHS